MRIVSISDTHGQHRKLSLPDGDLFIHAGDASNGRPRELEDFIEWMVNLPFEHKIFVPGNMDYAMERDPDRYLAQMSGIDCLIDQSVNLQGLLFHGSPVVPNFVGVFNRERGEEIMQHWDLIPTEVDILVTHGPPAGILDRTSSGLEVGCKNLLAAFARIRPKVHVFGHVHEGYGELDRGETHFINASYGWGNHAIVFDL